MSLNTLSMLSLTAPVLLLFGALLSSGKSKGFSLTNTGISLFGIVIAAISAVSVSIYGYMESAMIGWKELGFSIRLDALSTTIFVMIAILGFIIHRYSVNYMDGEPRRNVFLKRLVLTISAVELLILSGNIFQILFFWVITSFCLHSLLVFYRNRPQAVAAARKKFIVARLGDACLLAATVLIYLSFGTGDLGSIFDGIKSSDFTMTGSLNWATGLLVVAAALKSAQFPTHGWLIEVVETPTPVSSLLHAGLLNAGPFLMVRMSYLMVESSSASIMLIIIGGLTALIASVIYLTQPSVKVALGYSSVAHMGFSLLICGFGVYSAAILHVVAHSFYKAHSFLSSGSVIDRVRARKVQLPKREGKVFNVGLSVLLSLGLYFLFSYLWGIHPEENFNLMALGIVIVMGLSQLLIATLESKGGWKAALMTFGISLAVYTSFFTLEHTSRALLGAEIATVHQPNRMVQSVIITLLSLYGIVILAQLVAPNLKTTAWGYRLGIHIRNGLYANVIFDRMIGSLKNEKFKWANLTVKEEEQSTRVSDHSEVSIVTEEPGAYSFTKHQYIDN